MFPLQKKSNLVILAGLFIVVISAVFTASAATTIGSSISTDGTLTVNGSSTLGNESSDTITLQGKPVFNTNLDLNLQTTENLSFDWGSNPDAAALRTALGSTVVGAVHRLSSTSPYVADYWNVTGNSTDGPSLFYNTIKRNSNGTADTLELYQLGLENDGDSGDRLRMMNLVYNATSDQPGTFMATSYMLMLDMDENITNFAFPNGIIIEAGQGGDDTSIDNLIATAINVSDADINDAIDIGVNNLKVGSDGVFTIKANTDSATNGVTITSQDIDGSTNIDLKLDPKGSGKVLIDFRQADLAAGSCTAGEFAVDTGGATKEFCFCQATNTWYCSAVSNVNGPAD